MRNKYSGYWQAFNKEWFIKHQKTLLWLLNAPIIKYIFRYCLRIEEKKNIFEIAPNYYKVNLLDGQIEVTFRTHDKYSKRIYFAFFTIWWVAHFADWLFLDRFVPEYSFGLDTLTVYPQAGGDPGYNTTCDGHVLQQNTSGDTFSNIRSANPGSASSYSAQYLEAFIQAYTSTNKYVSIFRCFFTFATSGLGSGATINSAKISLCSDYKTEGFSTIDSDTHIVASSQVANNTLDQWDYQTAGATSFGSIAYASVSIAGTYNDIALNASGLSNISKTGISKFAMRVGADLNNVEPTWVSGAWHYIEFFSADNTGTSQDPKLVVTYNEITTNYRQMGIGLGDLGII